LSPTAAWSIARGHCQYAVQRRDALTDSPGHPGAAQRVGGGVGIGRCGDGGTPGVTGGVVVGVGVGVGVRVGGVVVGAGPDGSGVDVAPVGVGVPSPGSGDGVTTTGPAVAAGTDATSPPVPGTVGVGPGDVGALGPVADRMGTVAPGPRVGGAPRVPIRPVETLTDAGAGGVEPVGPAGSAGPPTTTVRRVTATIPPPATPSAWRVLLVPRTGFGAPWRAAPAAMGEL
jgi:hypothetical protein